ncbi:hypothetical protein MB02_16440 [Croceicoccus estronivorus]|uniref:DUF805 domain-containing protein n=1 Tax=Croceicoccus estronivorus TaxID=1172626 RepID=UPI000832F5EC|nr:DUF805 domain-containing protein [Croceicoccus estronivorus]OCC22524.1 hypothetical protein MB02_16440 [Croceicoccus estronivorus]
MEWMILPLKRYADFSGRSRRLEFWMFALLNVIVSFVLMTVMLAGGVSLAELENPGAGMPAFGGLFWIAVILLLVWGLGTIIPGIAVSVRRLHDRDMSGWWYLGLIVAYMIPFVNLIAGIAFLVLMLLPGTPGPNRYGADPKDPMSADVFA